MPHQTLSTRNDYEQKINYDWPKLHFPQKFHQNSSVFLKI